MRQCCLRLALIWSALSGKLVYWMSKHQQPNEQRAYLWPSIWPSGNLMIAKFYFIYLHMRQDESTCAHICSRESRPEQRKTVHWFGWLHSNTGTMGMQTGTVTLGNRVEDPQKLKRQLTTPHEPAISLPCIYPKEIKQDLKEVSTPPCSLQHCSQ